MGAKSGPAFFSHYKPQAFVESVFGNAANIPNHMLAAICGGSCLYLGACLADAVPIDDASSEKFMASVFKNCPADRYVPFVGPLLHP